MDSNNQEKTALPDALPNVLPRQCCQRFEPRESILASVRQECWYCRYADFHLNNKVALDIGVCRYPKVQIV